MGRALRVVALCTTCALMVVAATNIAVRLQVRGLSHSTMGEVPRRGVAIVPGSPTSRRMVEATLLGRVEGALALYRSGRASTILISGVDVTKDPETSAMHAWLLDHGVAPGDIVSDDRGYRTRETMFRANSHFGVTNAIICTEPINMPRALFLARQNGLDAVGFELRDQSRLAPRRIGREALKTTLAVFEEIFAPKRAPEKTIAAL